MVENITQATVTMTRAASAAGMPIRALRRAALTVPRLGAAGRVCGEWRRYNALDCVRLAIVGRLLAFGVSLPAAVEVLEAVDNRLLALVMCGIELPASFLTERLDGLTVHVVPGSDGLNIYTAPRGMAPVPADAVLSLDIGFIADDVIARLDATQRTAADTHGRSTGGRAGAAAGAPIPLRNAGTPPALTPEITP